MPRVSKSAAVQAGRVDDASRDDAKGGAHEMSLAALTTEFAPSGDVAVTGMQRLDMAAGARGVAAQKGDVLRGAVPSWQAGRCEPEVPVQPNSALDAVEHELRVLVRV